MALPSITGMAAEGPMFPGPSKADPSLTTPTAIPNDREAQGCFLVLSNGFTGAGNARGVGDGEIVVCLHGQLVKDANLPAQLFVNDEAAFCVVFRFSVHDRVDSD